jgi:hypothetical protein
MPVLEPQFRRSASRLLHKKLTLGPPKKEPSTYVSSSTSELLDILRQRLEIAK